MEKSCFPQTEKIEAGGACVQARGLSKRYGTTEALRGVDCDIPAGTVFGLVGPDGAGKTTLLRILASLLLPDAGTARVAGYDVCREFRQVRQRLGYVPGQFSLYEDLSVEENLQFFASIFHTTPAAHRATFDAIYRQLEPFRKRRAGRLSGGMKQKLALCCALVHKPDVLLLDEPTTGVDAVSRFEFWQVLRPLRDAGMCIIVATPYMDEAARCDRLALIWEGRFLATGTPEQLVARFPPGALWAVRGATTRRLLADVRAFKDAIMAFSFGEWVHATCRPGFSPAALSAWLQDHGHTGVEIQHQAPSIEDYFMWLTEQEKRQPETEKEPN